MAMCGHASVATVMRYFLAGHPVISRASRLTEHDNG